MQDIEFLKLPKFSWETLFEKDSGHNKNEWGGLEQDDEEKKQEN